jgi:hypothetical protein
MRSSGLRRLAAVSAAVALAAAGVSVSTAPGKAVAAGMTLRKAADATSGRAATAGQRAGKAAASAVGVNVDAAAGLGTVPGGAIGLNTAVYDGYMTDSPVPALLKAAGINALRYPGGSYGDIFNWQSDTAPGGYVAPHTGFDTDFMPMAQSTGAAPIVIVNYGSGTPQLAASWVQDANVTHKYGIKYWEVGNEVYGNGFYGSGWETDQHSSKSPDTYAANYLQFASAMKAVDPSVKVCAVLTTPGFWPDGVVGSGDTMDWNHTFLSIVGSKIDCAIVHYYPGGANAAAMLTDPSDISGIVSTLHSEIKQYGGTSNVPVLVTETNSSIDMDTQPAALFAADTYTTWLENGIVNVDWWDEHNGPGTPTTVGGVQDYNDQGIFSNGGSSSGVTEPPLETPFAPYYGIQMLTKLMAPGDTMVSSHSDNSLVAAHAVRRAGGDLDVLLINKDPSNSYTVNLNYSGFTPTAGTPTVYRFANNATSITSSQQGSPASQTIPPYSLTVVHLTGSGGTGATAPGAPGQPTVSNLTSTSATLNWQASVAGTYPIADYQVYQQGSNGQSTLVGTTTSTSFPLTGLTVGDSYTYNVVAVDDHGNPSLPSAPVTFVAPPPSNASCAVHYAVNNTWPGGFGANITITDNSSTAINGWTLTFTWPDAGEAVSSGWNGTFQQTGQSVTVTNASWNASIGANGGSVSVGFNGSDTGQSPAPTVFRLNGTVCSMN